MNLSVLLLSIISGLFFLGGFLFTKLFKENEKLNIFATSMALVVMLGMLLFDLFPEVFEVSKELSYDGAFKTLLILGFIVLGILVLKVFDVLLPHHEHNHEHEIKKEHENHEHHVGIIITFPLIIHNVLEGMGMYLVGINNFKAGILMSLAVGLHNFPLGIEISSSMKAFNSKKKNIILISLVLSGLLGSFIMLFLNNSVSNMFMLPMLSLACGMIIYIVLFELLKDVILYKKEKHTYFGFLVGIIIVLVMIFM